MKNSSLSGRALETAFVRGDFEESYARALDYVLKAIGCGIVSGLVHFFTRNFLYLPAEVLRFYDLASC